MRLVLLPLLWQLTNGLIAYDCQNSATNITIISLNDVAQCPDPEYGYTTFPRSIQIVQKNRFEKVHVQTCLVQVTRMIHHCGMHSHSSVVAKGLYTYLYKVGRENCKAIHQFREFRGLHGQVFSGLQPNGTIGGSVTLAGKLQTDGTCTGTTFTEDGTTWENVVVTATVTITIKDYDATLKLDQDEVVLHGGYSCSFLSGYCIDAVMGETAWDPVTPQECNSYATLYNGQGYLVRQKNTSNPIMYVVVEDGDRIFALSLIKTATICGTLVWQTEHPKLLVLEKEPGARMLNWGNHARKENIDLTVYVNSKFLYMEQSLKTSIDRAYAHTVHRRCLLRREILLNRLVLAPLSPNTISTLVKGQAGFVGKVAGEVLYILQCVPRVVEIRRETTCYAELPVKVDNTSYFMSPITRILQRYAEQMECNSLIPPLYYINNRWTSFSPNPGTAYTPAILEVDTETKLTFTPIQNLGAGGIYTAQEIREAQDAMLFGFERKALSNILTRKMVGQNVETQGVSLLHMFSAEEIEKLAESALDKMWGWFRCIGTWTSGLIGIYCIIRFIKILIEILINAIAIQKEHGWSLKILASFWDTMTIWLLHKKHKKDVSSRLHRTLGHLNETNHGDPAVLRDPNHIGIASAPTQALATSADDSNITSTTSPTLLTRDGTVYTGLNQAVQGLKNDQAHTWI